MTTYRQPYGSSVVRFPFMDYRATTPYESSLTLDGVQPARFLPIIQEDNNKQMPIVLWPGTIVGVLNDRDHTAVPASFRTASPYVMVPAYAGATYTVTYTALDLSTSSYGGSDDLDESLGTLATSAGASTTTIASVKPLGIVQEPIYSQAFYDRHYNLQQQHTVSMLSRGRIVRIPCITAEEKLIYPGDIVMVSDTSSSHDPIGAPTASYPGRWKKWDESTVADLSFVIGRCVGRHKIVSQSSASAATQLLTDVTNDALNTSTLNTREGYRDLAKVQTVPGISLQGSGTGGIPGHLLFSRSDSNGDYWAIDIAIGVIGI